MFERSKYYSQTEIVSLFQISVKRLKELIADRQIKATEKDVDLGGYSVKALYYLREEIDKLNLIKKISLP